MQSPTLYSLILSTPQLVEQFLGEVHPHKDTLAPDRYLHHWYIPAIDGGLWFFLREMMYDWDTVDHTHHFILDQSKNSYGISVLLVEDNHPALALAE